MKYFRPVICVGVGTLLAGCMTSTKVQKMIDLSTQGAEEKIVSHDDAIDQLQEMADNAKKERSETIAHLQEVVEQIEAVEQYVSESRSLANAAKVMSAENTVKLADLEELLVAYKKSTDTQIDQMANNDKLYEEVLIQQYQSIADSANAAIEALRNNGLTANEPVDLERPIEITAPDTSVPMEETDTESE